MSPAALANWASLSNPERHAAARWMARRLMATGTFRRLGSGVVGIGFGFRERRPKRRGGRPRYGKSVVLVVTVRKKWKAGRRGRLRAVPPKVEVRVPLGQRRILLAIPTDVCQARRPRPHADPDACRSESMYAGEPGVEGSVAALVRNAGQAGGPIYLLGCQHVFHRTLLTWNSAPDPTAQVYARPAGSALLGPATRPAPFGPRVDSVDASLVLLTDAGLAIARKKSFWPKVATDYMKDSTQLDNVTGLAWKLYSRFEPAGLSYVRTRLCKEIEYGSNSVTVRIIEVVVSRSTGREPKKGDSGGAVMVGPLLVGIHIAGEGPLSYCIPAYRLFSTAAFKPKLELASDLISP
jgi:hypothetical protein